MSHCSSSLRRLLARLPLFAALLVTFLGAATLPARAAGGPARGGPDDVMPPHPNVEARIRKGEVQMPRVVEQADTGAQSADAAFAAQALTGHIKALAVLVDFSDQVSSVSASFFDSLIFAAPVAGRGSVSDYFSDVSYGQVDIVTLNLPSAIGWRRAPQTEAYYVGTKYCTQSYPNNCQKLAEDIVDAINGVVNFKDYDNNGDGYMEPLMIVHAGPGAEYSGSLGDIWSHSWGLYSPKSYDGVVINRYVIMPEYWGNGTTSRYDMTIGVFAHEMGHGFWGLPDLYDTDYSSEGIGNWSLMAGGSWNGPSGLGGSPAWPDAYSRIRMGYTSPTALAADATGQSIPQANAASTGTIFKLKNSVLSGYEYFLVENRQKTAGTYDEYLPGSGLAIWHVDEAKGGNTQECTSDPHSLCPTNHYLVALEQADGLHHMESNQGRGDANDVFPGGTNNRSWSGSTHPESSSWSTSTPTNISVANISASAATMTADLNIYNGPPPPPSININDVTVAEGNSGTVPAVFTVSLSSAPSSPVTVNWATADGTATATSGDYVAGSGTLTFAAGQTSQAITVNVNGDTSVESNETFSVKLSNPTGATLADSQGVGTITNDDVDPATRIHIGDLDGTKSGTSRKWNASVTVTLHDGNHIPVAGVLVTGTWSNKGSTSCTTTTGGQCTMSKTGLNVLSISFTVTNASKTGLTYTSGANHDPDADSTGTVITIGRP
jgi:immune inhibitor A